MERAVSKQMKDYSSVFLRLALGISFLAAVADRFGLWGSFGQPNVAWGDFSHFVAYTRKLNWFIPSAAIPALAWAATCLEVLLGAALVLGAFTRVVAFLSGRLLLLFALSMTFALQATFGCPKLPHRPNRSATAARKEMPRASRKNTKL